MGNARFVDVDWNRHAYATSAKSRDQIFTQRDIHPDLDPAKVKFREAVDSDANPEATPIILGADETGSMGILAETIIKGSLGTIMKELYARKPVTDPQIMCMALGDANCDSAPLQVTQFEASVEPMVDQIAKMYLEGHGGGNGGESYSLAWFFAAYKTKCDAIRKRHRKGYIFTIGDESPHPTLTKDQLTHFLGVSAETDMNSKVLLADTQKDWHVFHLIVSPVTDQQVEKNWKALLRERAILVPDIERLAEGIVAIIQLVEGGDPHVVMNGWKGDSALAVRTVTAQLVSAGAK